MHPSLKEEPHWLALDRWLPLSRGGQRSDPRQGQMPTPCLSAFPGKRQPHPEGPLDKPHTCCPSECRRAYPMDCISVLLETKCRTAARVAEVEPSLLHDIWPVDLQGNGLARQVLVHGGHIPESVPTAMNPIQLCCSMILSSLSTTFSSPSLMNSFRILIASLMTCGSFLWSSALHPLLAYRKSTTYAMCHSVMASTSGTSLAYCTCPHSIR